jgi:hypothetical protein
MRVASTLALGAASMVVACGARTPLSSSSSSSSSPPPGEAPGDDAASPCIPAGPAGSACNALSPAGRSVHSACVSGPAPSPAGGTIVDGTYVLVASRFFGGCPIDETDRIVWQVCGSAWATVQEVMAPNEMDVKTIDATADVEPGNATVGFTLTCAPNGTPNVRFGYDATPASLTLYVYQYGPGIVRVDDFALQ